MAQGDSAMNTWSKVKLGDVISYRKGYAFESSHFIAAGIPVIRISDTTRTSVKDNLSSYVDPEYSIGLKDFELKEKDVVLTTVGSRPPMYDSMVGKAISIPKKNAGSLLNQNMVILRGVPLTLEQDYLAINLRTKRFVYFIETIIRGNANQVSIALKELFNYKFLLPPIPEQKAIADLLSTWDEAIEKTERLVQAKERRLDAYARDLFDRKNDGKYEGWKVVKLKTVLIELGDKSTGAEEVFSVSVHKGLVNQIEHLGRSFSAANTDNYNCVHYGDIVYTKSPTGDFPLGIVKQSYTKADVIVSPLYGVFSPRTFNLGIILDFYFSSPARARNYLFPIVQKGAKNTIAITNKTFLSGALHLPVDEKAQKAVAEFVYAAREEIDLQKQLADKYKTQKRGLMQRLLTGDWRINPDFVKAFEE